MREGLPLAGLAFSLFLGAVDSSRAGAFPTGSPWGSGWEWRRLAGSEGEGPTTAVAWHEASDRTAISDGRGVWVGRVQFPGGQRSGRRYSGVGFVADLKFADQGGLWIASENGLWLLTEDGRLENRFPAAGEADRRMHRISLAGDLHVAVGESGAFASVDGLAWSRLTGGLPLVPFHALALRTLPGSADGFELWLGGAVDVWRLEVKVHSGKLEAGRARRVRPAGRPLEERPVDLALDLGGSEVVILYPRALARSLTSADGSLRWETVFPVWSPGSRARRVFGLAGQVFVATDQGLLRAMQWPLSWRRTTGPPGVSGMWAMAEQGGGALLAAGDPGAFSGAVRKEFGADEPIVNSGVLQQDPPLRQLQTQALIYTGLRPEYFKRLRSGLSRRGWWPSLELDAGVAYDRSRTQDDDQSFTYGTLQDLRDQGRASSRDFEAVVSLSWDLGELAYPTDAPELSREARQRVSLRDNMLDEVNQLYFDRRRALLAWEAFGDKSDPEAVLLQLRAEELAAGLDAWTGGWFSVWRPPASSLSSSSSSSSASNSERERAGDWFLQAPSSPP